MVTLFFSFIVRSDKYRHKNYQKSHQTGQGFGVFDYFFSI